MGTWDILSAFHIIETTVDPPHFACVVLLSQDTELLQTSSHGIDVLLALETSYGLDIETDALQASSKALHLLCTLLALSCQAFYNFVL